MVAPLLLARPAWFNGDGVEAWQDVWGVWNGMKARDGEILRRAAAMLRHFGHRGFLRSRGWVPHAPAAVQPESTKLCLRRL